MTGRINIKLPSTVANVSANSMALNEQLHSLPSSHFASRLCKLHTCACVNLAQI